MHEILAFYRYEMRRHAPMIGVCLSTWLIFFFGHRLLEGSWNYWRGDLDWEILGTIFAAMVTPFLSFAVAERCWSGDRVAGLSQWTYARPVSADGIFLARSAALLSAAVLYAVGSLILNAGASPERMVEIFSLIATTDRWQAYVGLGVLLILGSLFGSALAKGWTFTVAGLLFAGMIYLAFVAWALLSPGAEQMDLWSWALSGQLLAAHWLLMCAGLFFGAWAAVRRAPDDPARFRRGLIVAAPFIVVALAVLAILKIHPLHLGTVEVAATFPLSDGTQVEIVRSSAMKEAHYVARNRPEAVHNFPLNAIVVAPEGDHILLRHAIYATRRAIGARRAPWWIRVGVERRPDWPLRISRLGTEGSLESFVESERTISISPQR